MTCSASGFQHPSELRELLETLLARKEQLRLQDAAVDDLKAILSPDAEPEQKPMVSETALREHCYRAARHEERAQAVIVDAVAARVAESYRFPELPSIVREVGELFSLSEAQTRIIAALCAVEDDENLETLLRRSKYRTTIAVMAELADLDTTEFVQETAAGSMLERLGLVCYRGNREHALDIEISGPLLFAVRSNTMDDLHAGLFEETPAPRFGLEEFPVSRAELRTCSAALRGGHPVLIAGRPGIGKTEFVRTLVASLGRSAATLAAAARAGERSCTTALSRCAPGSTRRSPSFCSSFRSSTAF